MENVVNWQGKKVFITGHTGFKGGWLSLWLAHKGAILRGYALLPPTEPNLFTDASVDSVIDHVHGDVRNYVRLEAAMKEFEPQVVFHLAAQPLVRQSYLDPVETFSTNILGTVNVLEAVRNTPSVKAVVCVTSDKVYENQEWEVWYRESDKLGGSDPYSASKACCELVCSSYRNSFFTGIWMATARAGNVIGGGDWAKDRLIPDLMRGMYSGKATLIRNPDATRPFQHVLDALHGYILLAESLLQRRQRGAFNFGPVESYKVSVIAEKLRCLSVNTVLWTTDANEQSHEECSLRLDSKKANEKLGWKPLLDIDTALQWTLEWYRKQHGVDMKAETLKQIRQFESLIASQSEGALRRLEQTRQS